MVKYSYLDGSVLLCHKSKVQHLLGYYEENEKMNTVTARPSTIFIRCLFVYLFIIYSDV